jgi:uncharacterized protein (TIGR04168 family)
MTEVDARIAVVGDLHSDWHEFDVAYFNRSDYALVALTGDLSAGSRRDGLRIARSLSQLERRTLVMPGNNDVPDYAQVAAELSYQRGRAGLMNAEHAGTPGVEMAGYACHRLRAGARDITIVSARPFAMGGSELSFPALLEQSFGVRSLEESSERLKALVDEAGTSELLFLSHNGPRGLGEDAAAPWGRDFSPEPADWGDSDLEDAVSHAKQRGLRVLAVLGGHMHWQLRNGGQRRWHTEIDGVTYVNAARVPRIFEDAGDYVHHHVELTFGAGGVSVGEVLVRRNSGSGAESAL